MVATMVAKSEANQWRHWRGSTGNGTAPLASPPTNWSPNENVKWKAKIPGRGSGSPVVWDKRVFVVTAVPTGQDGETPRGDPTRCDAPDKRVRFGPSLQRRRARLRPLWIAGAVRLHAGW